ncbi:Surfeit locus protein 6 [Geosmithia morbida]|uniref:Surfeit locus protein 6 n=1 Tax=Geosmithia morbida TaxID=1094350 RepID=A0A9P4YR05_9HYPO|nr:Surfeit locus protein 6 [Geosmithia morbida]KAF4121523.1 Surfeit locus protein 6 [Geosmithia morbida]
MRDSESRWKESDEETSLQDRLQAQASGFDGLLSLIPAKMYYGEDNAPGGLAAWQHLHPKNARLTQRQQQDQWKRKKQSKAEAKAARRAKLDPDSQLNRNAKEVMDQRAQNKRKLEQVDQDGSDDDDDDDEADDASGGASDNNDPEQMDDSAINVEKPREGLKKKKDKGEHHQQHKKQKRDADVDDDTEKNDEGDGGTRDDGEWEDDVDDEDGDVGGERIKLSRKQAKMAARAEKRRERKAEKKAKKAEAATEVKSTETTEPKEAAPAHKKKSAEKKKAATEKEAATEGEAAEENRNQNKDKGEPEPEPELVHQATVEEQQQEEDGSASAESGPQSPTFDTGTPNNNNNNNDNSNAADASSAPTSVSSAADAPVKPKHIKIPNDTSALRARLAAKIEALRAARKADGPDGKPIRTRQELIESRRHKELQRKARKEELRAAAKLEEQRLREEALATNSPSVMSPAVELGEDDGTGSGNLAFGRVSFGDGSQLSHDLSYTLRDGGGNGRKRPGPSDPKTALLKVQAQKKRLQNLDEDKRKEVAEKEAWLAARRRAEGVKVHDNEALLKKSVKRKEALKRKSEKAWKDRQKGVAHAQHEKQKKREDNIRKRRDDKLAAKKGKGKGKKSKSGGTKKKGRPGFEGIGGGK